GWHSQRSACSIAGRAVSPPENRSWIANHNIPTAVGKPRRLRRGGCHIRPAVIGKSGELSSAVIVVGIFGGIAVLGPIGLFVGPVILGTAKISFDLFAREWYKSKTA
ncbi:MAG: hypothetical protein M8354_15745, partial [Halalkalicoccus sp.]|nr:hypothetical protein [Halalkalicoccus sp.]